MYAVKRLHVDGTWHYFNMFKTYKEARDAIDYMTARYGGKFRIFEEE